MLHPGGTAVAVVILPFFPVFPRLPRTAGLASSQGPEMPGSPFADFWQISHDTGTYDRQQRAYQSGSICNTLNDCG